MLFAVAFTPQIRAAQPARYDWAEEIRTLSRPELLPRYRTGCIVEGISSFDPTGGNDDGFSGRYSYIRKENGKLVLADLKGPGVINRIFTPTPTCDTISFYFDGESIPRISLPFEDLFPAKYSHSPNRFATMKSEDFSVTCRFRTRNHVKSFSAVRKFCSTRYNIATSRDTA